MVGAVTEGQDVAWPARDVEFCCVRAVLTFVPIARPVEEHRAPSFGNGDVADGHIAGHGAPQHLNRGGQSEQFVDRIGYQFGLSCQQPPLIWPLVQQLHGATQHAGGGVVASGDHRERERQDGEHSGDVTVGTDPGGHQVGHRVVFRFGAAPLDERGEVGHHAAERITHRLQCSADASLRRAGRDDRIGPAVELPTILLGDTEIVRDDHRRKGFEQFGDDVAAAVALDALDTFDDVLPDLRLDRLDLSRGETAGDQLAEFGVHGRILHDHRWVVREPDEIEFAVVDGQALSRRERLVIPGRCPDVGMAGEHVVVPGFGSVGLSGGNHVMDGIMIAQRLIHRPGISPGRGVGQLEPHRHILRQNRSHVLSVRQFPALCQ